MRPKCLIESGDDGAVFSFSDRTARPDRIWRPNALGRAIRAWCGCCSIAEKLGLAEEVLPQLAEQPHRAATESAFGRRIRSCRAVRSEREREDRAVVAKLDQAFRPYRREAVGRCRADHQASARRVGRVRRLFIRETTSIDNHTYRFARRACSEGMPVIDDPISMIRCTNNVFLMELLQQNQVPTPPTVTWPRSRPDQGDRRTRSAVVVKIPDGSFSRRRAQDRIAGRAQAHLRRAVRRDRPHPGAEIFGRPISIWRVRRLAGEPLFVCQYRMARGHWRAVKYPARRLVGMRVASAPSTSPRRHAK